MSNAKPKIKKSPLKKKKSSKKKSVVKKTLPKTVKKKSLKKKTIRKKSVKKKLAKKAPPKKSSINTSQNTLYKKEEKSKLYDYLKMSSKELENILKNNPAPNVELLNSYLYRGLRLGLSARLLRLQKIIIGFYFAKKKSSTKETNPKGKGFSIPENENKIVGYHIACLQNKLKDSWETKKIKEKVEPGLNKLRIRRFGFFHISTNSKFSKYPRAATICYKKTFGRLYLMKDVLVRLKRNHDNLLLAKAYICIGPIKIPSGYYILEKTESVKFKG